MKSQAKALVLFTLLLAAACSGGDSKDGRLLGADPAQSTTENERIRRMMAVRVVQIAPNGSPMEVVEWESEQLYDSLDVVCKARFEQCGGTPTGCLAQVCAERQALCAGEILLAIAKDEVMDLALPPFETEDPIQSYKLLPQNTATKVALSAEAVERLYAGINTSLSALRSNGPCTSQSDRDTYAPELASAALSGFHAARDAQDALVASVLAVSDAERSSTPSRELGEARSVAQPSLSRTALAHYLVGGRPGLKGDVDSGFCDVGPLSGPAQAALKVLREAGVHPFDVFVEPIDKLLNGTDAEVPSGSVRRRLLTFWDQPVSDSGPGIEEYYRLKQGDFEEARSYLKQELTAFSRYLGAYSPVFRNGVELPYLKYSAIANPPPDRDAAYFAALASTDCDGSYCACQLGFGQTCNSDKLGWNATAIESFPPLGGLDQAWRWRPAASSILSAGLYGGNIATKIDSVFSQVHALVKDPALQNVDVYKNTVFGTLRGIGEHFPERPARLTHCTGGGALDTIKLNGYGPADEVLVVKDEPLLEFLTHGTVEGGPNSDGGDILFFAVGEFGTAATPDVGFDIASEMSWFFEGDRLPSIPERWYLVRTKVAGQGGPGQWEALAGFVPYAHTSTARMCRDIPIVPKLMDQVKEAMTPSRQNCGISKLSCAGVDFDERLPLEDELSSDADGVESSWKHYLALADEAATESDLLGQEYVRAAIEVDRNAVDVELRKQAQQEKASAKLEELQELCGTAIDPAKLIEALAGLAAQFKPTLGSQSVGNFSVGALMDLGPCVEDNNPQTKCFGERNSMEINSFLKFHTGQFGGELGKLQKCLVSMSSGGRIHLGTRPVCVWPDTSGFGLCAQAPEGQVCPDLADENGICPSNGTLVSTGLGYFDTDKVLPPTATPTMCGAIRFLRSDPNHAIGRQKLDELIGSDTFNPDGAALRADVTFEAAFGTHGTILAGNAPRWSTGTPYGGPQSSAWPCNEGAIASNCGNGVDGLFCQTRDCTVAAERASIIMRMIKAVAAAQLMKLRNQARAPTMLLPGYIAPGFVLSSNSGIQELRVGGTGLGLIREHPSIKEPDRFGDPAHGTDTTIDGRVYTTQAGSGAPLEAFFQPGVGMRGILSPTGENFAIIRGVIGKSSEPRHSLSVGSIVSYDSIGNFFSGLSLWNNGKTGYFAEVLRGQRFRTDTRVTDGPFALPTNVWVDGGFVEFGDDVSLDLEEFPLLPFVSFAPSFDFDPEALLDGLELLCELESSENSFNTGNCGAEPLKVNGLDDLQNIVTYLDCFGRTIQRRGALTVFADFPKEAEDALRENSPAGSHGAVTGTLGAQYSDLRGALLEVAASAPGIGRELSGLSLDINDLRIQSAVDANHKEISNLQFWSTVASQVASCADSATSAVKNFSSFGAHAAINCANALAQIGFASEINRLSKKNIELGQQLEMNRFNERFAARVDALEDLSIRLTAAVETVDGALIEIENSRTRAQRIMNEALWLLSNESKTQATLNTVLAKGKESAQVRYLRAFQNAKLMSFLAKRAIEQRLGMRLADMTDDLPLVAAPATWEGNMCAQTGIDYDKLAEDGGPYAASNSMEDAFIGDYVNKLKNVVESYRLEFNFHEGADIAVVSLRDDVQNVRAPCDTESKNLFYHSAQLDLLASDTASPGWLPDGCRTTTEDDQQVPIQECISVSLNDQPPFTSAALEQRSVPGFKLRFGDLSSCTDPTLCGWQSGAGLVQQLSLTPGLYRFSWYSPDAKDTLGSAAGFARTASGEDLKPAPDDPAWLEGDPRKKHGFVQGDSSRWHRPYFLFELTTATDVKVGFRSPNNQAEEVRVAAPMLEAVDSTGVGVTKHPTAFSATTDTRLITLPVCEDTQGQQFRLTQWQRQCVKLCPDGFGSECAGDEAQTQCYRETSFNVTQRGIESGGAFVQSGFARGNFNYRIDSIGLNFVGTGIRNCENEPLATSCHGAGYVTYSLEHNGPYLVRNHAGLDYDARLFPGRIEHARGLGTERYLTNPMSSADSELIATYLRGEFRGRPLDGNFVLRVWEEPGFDFNAIQDVQVLLNYRYWTRFQ
jgi:hypothetical protein